MSHTYHYSDSVKMTFDPAKHEYVVQDGEVVRGVPSVTNITRLVDKSAPLMAWAAGCTANYIDNFLTATDFSPDREAWPTVLKDAKTAHRSVSSQAQDIGTMVHAAIANFFDDSLEKPAVMVEVAVDCYSKFLNWWVTKHWREQKVEQRVLSLKYGFAGTVDFCALVREERNAPEEWWVCDWKASNTPYPAQALQLAGYAIALEEEFGVKADALKVVALPKENTKRSPNTVKVLTLENEQIETAKQGFLGLLAAYNSLQAMKGVKPTRE